MTRIRPEADPWRARALAEAAVQRAAEELRAVLKGLAQSLDPFPGFQGMATLQAVEAEPGAMRDPERGCVVVDPEGDLYELTVRVIGGPIGSDEMDQVEELRLLELAPRDYIPYAYGAIQELARLHQERRAQPQ